MLDTQPITDNLKQIKDGRKTLFSLVYFVQSDLNLNTGSGRGCFPDKNQRNSKL